MWKLQARHWLRREREIFRAARKAHSERPARSLYHSWRFTRHVWNLFDEKLAEAIDRELITGDGTGTPRGIE